MGKLHGRQLNANMCVSTAQVLTRMSAASLPIEITGCQFKFAAASYIGVHICMVCASNESACTDHVHCTTDNLYMAGIARQKNLKMPKYFYAVRVGRERGVYNSW